MGVIVVEIVAFAKGVTVLDTVLVGEGVLVTVEFAAGVTVLDTVLLEEGEGVIVLDAVIFALGVMTMDGVAVEAMVRSVLSDGKTRPTTLYVSEEPVPPIEKTPP